MGKVFKPALKRLANVEAVATLLNQHNIIADVTTEEDATCGLSITRQGYPGPGQLEEAKHLGQSVFAIGT